MYVIIALLCGSKSGWKDVSKVEGVRAFFPPAVRRPAGESVIISRIFGRHPPATQSVPRRALYVPLSCHEFLRVLCCYLSPYWYIGNNIMAQSGFLAPATPHISVL